MTPLLLAAVVYTLGGLGTALVLAYRYALDMRLASLPTRWRDDAPIFVGIGLVWPFALALVVAAHALLLLARTIEATAAANVEARREEQENDR